MGVSAGELAALDGMQSVTVAEISRSHAVPFDPARLLDFWQRCGRTPAGVERCAPGLRNAEAPVAGVAPPALELWLANEPAEEASGAARGAQPAQDENAEPEADRRADPGTVNLPAERAGR